MRRTKIVATLGPASSDPEKIRELILAGVNVFRLNFSHGSRESHVGVIHHVREIACETGIEVALLQDLCGPKIRVEEIENGAVELVADSEVAITTRKVVGDATRFCVSYKALPRDVVSGSRILLDDGKLELAVLSASGEDVLCRVVRGGVLRSRKGVNLPDTPLSTPSVTRKDMQDLAVGIEEGVDFVALSFVRTADDVRKVRKILEKREKNIPLIAKIEKPEALENLDEIIQAADGILVARGDLGVEMPLAQVPVLQKDIIRRANEADKIVITATQMLESMISSPVPTRAEVSDVANAIADGTDAVMLSGETAVGEYPIEAVRTMAQVAEHTEKYFATHNPGWDWLRLNPIHPVQDAIGHAVYNLYRELDVKAIAAFSVSGSTGLFLSKSRPFAPIIVFTSRKEALRRMQLTWGVVPVLDENIASAQELSARAEQYISVHRLAEVGQRVLIVAGSHFGSVGANNRIEITTHQNRAEEATPKKKSARKTGSI
jgi:pyruvate kinase